MTRSEHAVEDLHVDPLDDAPEVSPRGSLALTVAGFVFALAALLPTGLTFVFGPLGMGCGLVAHLKGRRAGFAAAAVAAAATVIGLSFQFYLNAF